MITLTTNQRPSKHNQPISSKRLNNSQSVSDKQTNYQSAFTFQNLCKVYITLRSVNKQIIKIWRWEPILNAGVTDRQRMLGNTCMRSVIEMLLHPKTVPLICNILLSCPFIFHKSCFIPITYAA